MSTSARLTTPVPTVRHVQQERWPHNQTCRSGRLQLIAAGKSAYLRVHFADPDGSGLVYLEETTAPEEGG